MRTPSKHIKRKVRRARYILAWIIQPGYDDQECQVMDISKDGAKIATTSSQVSDRFELTFTRSDDKRRLCEVAWRRGKLIGVRFVRE
jgi:PilZ domain